MAKSKAEAGREYQHFVAGYLCDCGFVDVCETPDSGDYGVDIIAYKDGQKYAVQCKHHEQYGCTGYDSIKDVFTGMHLSIYNTPDRCVCGVVVTNTSFSAQAVKAADDLGLELWTGIEFKLSDGCTNSDFNQIFEYLSRRVPLDWNKLNVSERHAWLSDGANVGVNLRYTVGVSEILKDVFDVESKDITRDDICRVDNVMKCMCDCWRKRDGVNHHKFYGRQTRYEVIDRKDWDECVRLLS